MRIVAGEWGGRPLACPKGRGTRPTSDRVREALFSIVGDLKKARVLDLFAGTGAVALEALSRGADRAVCVERASAALCVLRENAGRLSAFDRLEVRSEAVARFLAHATETFDFIFADPPWGEASRFENELGPLAAHRLARDDGVLIFERARRSAPPPPVLPVLGSPEVRNYGDTALAIYRTPS